MMSSENRFALFDIMHAISRRKSGGI